MDKSAALVSCSTEKSGWSSAKAHPEEILSVPTFVPDQAAAIRCSAARISCAWVWVI